MGLLEPMIEKHKKFRIKHFLNFKAGTLAFGIAFAICFFIGIFWNPPITTQVYDQNHRFYINRGYPVAWAGVSAINKTVDFPFVKAPFITQSLSEDNSQWIKVIDLRVFVPLFVAVFAVSYIFAFPFAKASEENKGFNIILIPAYILLVLLCIFFYFFWFPRI